MTNFAANSFFCPFESVCISSQRTEQPEINPILPRRVSATTDRGVDHRPAREEPAANVSNGSVFFWGQ